MLCRVRTTFLSSPPGNILCTLRRMGASEGSNVKGFFSGLSVLSAGRLMLLVNAGVGEGDCECKTAGGFKVNF